jgi:tellurite resistance protein
MSHLTEWAREAVAQLMRQTAVMLVARRERERVEAERWLRKLRDDAREAREARERAGKPPT